MSITHPPPRTLYRRILVLALLATLVVAVQQHQRAAQKIRTQEGGHINDFDRWMEMVPRFVHERVDYTDDLLPTPPLTIMMFAPFAVLSRANAQVAWVSVKLALVCLAFALAAGIVRRAGVRLTPSAALWLFAAWWFPVIVDMQEGQANFLALVPLMAGLAVAQRGTRLAQAAAGILIGLGTAVKVTPVIFLAYFFVKRRWTLTAAGIVSVALWLLLVPALAFGWDQNLRWLAQWTQIMIVPYVTEAKVVYATTLSVPSFGLRTLSHVPAFISRQPGGGDQYLNLLALEPMRVQQIVRAVMVAVAAAGLWWLRRPLATLESRRYVIEVGCVAAFMLWFSERTWIHHYVSFLLTLSAAAMVLSDPKISEHARRPVRIGLMLFALSALLASEAGKLLGPDGPDWARALGVFLWPSIIIVWALVRAARELREPRLAST